MTNEQLVARIRAGENEAENMLQLWQQNEGFIAKTARRYTGYAEIEGVPVSSFGASCGLACLPDKLDKRSRKGSNRLRISRIDAGG